MKSPKNFTRRGKNSEIEFFKLSVTLGSNNKYLYNIKSTSCCYLVRNTVVKDRKERAICVMTRVCLLRHFDIENFYGRVVSEFHLNRLQTEKVEILIRTWKLWYRGRSQHCEMDIATCKLWKD